MQKIMMFFSRFWLDRKIIGEKTYRLMCIIYTIIGFFSILIPFSDYLPAEWILWKKCLLVIGILFGFAFISCFVVTVRILRETKNQVFETNSGHKVYAEYGDMYSPSIVSENNTGRRNIVVSVNRCFDTIVDNDLISDTTQHGQIMKALYKNLYTPESLNEKIQEKLQGKDYKELTPAEKSKGNTRRYDVGTIAEIQGRDDITYFFWGLTKFDSHFKASVTKEELVVAIQRLIEYCNARSQGNPVIMPLVGTNLARTGISKQDILKYLVQVLKINRENISSDIHIVIREEDKDKVSIFNL